MFYDYDYSLMLNQVLKLSTGACQQFVENAIKLATTFTIQCSN